MTRCAFTIVYNGIHHLLHKGYAEYMAKHLDWWVFVDGLAGNGGSTNWCKDLKGCQSTDGTIEYLQGLQKKYPNIILQTNDKDRKWHSKDFMVNKAIELLKQKTNDALLWEIDADEQWTDELMMLSELSLLDQGAKTGEFHANYFMGKDLLAYGMWGEGVGYPYRRLWNWKGEYFQKHEPPELLRGNGKTVLLPYKFDHYSYYFEQDVLFKSQYYKGHERIHENWLKLNAGEIKTPCDLKDLFGHRRGVFQNTIIRAA